MKILVTGGAGFIGSAVVRHIIRNTKDKVLVLDCLTYAGNLESLTDVSSDARYSFEQVNICDRPELDRVFAQHKPDAVMHLAAESHVDRSIDGPSAFMETNIIGTYTLLESARQYWLGLSLVRNQTFVFIIFQLMRFMVICTGLMIFSRKQPLTPLVVLILPPRPLAIIWYELGIGLMVCQR